MSAKKEKRIEVLEYELVQLKQARKRASEDAEKALAIAEREIEIQETLDELKVA